MTTVDAPEASNRQPSLFFTEDVDERPDECDVDYMCALVRSNTPDGDSEDFNFYENIMRELGRRDVDALWTAIKEEPLATLEWPRAKSVRSNTTSGTYLLEPNNTWITATNSALR